MKVKELRQMSVKELEGKLNDLKLDLIKIKAQVAGGGSSDKNPSKAKQFKKTVAKIKTVIGEKIQK